MAKESSFGFSWAEEVEREEEQEREKENQHHMRIQREEREIRTKNGKRCDPFGAARPREVILEEKGVDWKKLDHDFSFDPSLAIRECKTKEIARKRPLETQKSQKNLPSQQSVPCEELVPPLKYPPKNIESVFEEIHRARKLNPNTNPNIKSKDQYCVEKRNLRGSNAKRAVKNCPHQPHLARWVSKLSKNENTLSNLNTVLDAKEKTGSNFEAKSVKAEGTKEGKHFERRVLGELNNSSCKDKVPCSNSYFGVLELLEPSSHEKLNSGNWSCNASARKRGTTVVSETEVLEQNVGSKQEAGKKNHEKATISKRRKGKRSNKQLM